MSSLISLIQARMSSSRLPGKVLLPLGGKPVLSHVIAACEAFTSQIVVCTSVDASDDPIASFCNSHGTICSRGPLEDVFSRFRGALADPRVKDAEFFARVTADSPMLSATLGRVLAAQLGPALDYVRPTPGTTPLGVGLEIVNRATFQAIDPLSLDGPEREHVTLRLYERSGRYRCRDVDPPPELWAPEYRLTLDFPEDYALLKRVHALTPEQAIEALRQDPALAAINASCVQHSAR